MSSGSNCIDVEVPTDGAGSSASGMAAPAIHRSDVSSAASFAKDSKVTYHQQDIEEGEMWQYQFGTNENNCVVWGGLTSARQVNTIHEEHKDQSSESRQCQL